MNLLDMKPVFAIVCKVFQIIAKLRCVREALVDGWMDGWQHSITAPCSTLALLLLFFSPCPAEIQICSVFMGKLGRHL